MVKAIELEAQKRELLGKKADKLRKIGLIPAVVYGRKISPVVVAVEKKPFVKILASPSGKNTIINLKVEGKSLPVLAHEIQYNVLDDEIIHIDFNHVVMDELVKAKIPVVLVGVPVGVKESGGVLVHGLREIEVECLPGDIPDNYEVDVTALSINQSLHVSDLAKDAKVKITSNPSEMVASCSPPTKEEEVAAPISTPAEVPSDQAAAVADEQVKEKSAPGAAPAKAEKTEK